MKYVSDPQLTVTGEREHATAFYIACKHLPKELMGTKNEIGGMLTEAASMFDSIGDKRGTDKCYKLMRSLGIACKKTQ